MTVYEYLSVLTSFISAVIAFVTVLFARKELRENRRYNEISVRPLLIITQHFGGSQERYGIAVKNAGLGPAIINHCEVLIRSNKMDEKEGDHGWDAAINKLNLKRKIELKKSIVAPKGNMAHGDRVWLLYIAKESINKENIDELQNSIKNSQLDIKILYESIFGEEFTERFLK